jgi:outer membrane protein assembly factor BamE (lipoprotein component of BamABCDE complex)
MFAPFRRHIPIIALLIGAAGLLACSPQIEVRGNSLSASKLAQVKPGAHTRKDIRKLLGTPSTVATFDSKTWYYFSERTSKVAFFHPDVLERQVVAIHFDKSGVVKEVRRYSKEDGREIDPVDRATQTPAPSYSLLEQLFGNATVFAR